MQKFVFILGAPRSGTRMLARCFGQSPETFLITEHKNKRRVPEETNTQSDGEYWAQCANDPARLRTVYERLSDAKFLVIKNPQNVRRIDMLKAAFSDAVFVWLLRNPWSVIQSMALAQREGVMAIRSESVLSLPDDPLLRAAASWCESVEAMQRYQDPLVRYEDLVLHPQRTLDQLSQVTGIRALGTEIPRKMPHDYIVVRYLLKRSPYREKALQRVAPLAESLGYPEHPQGIPGDVLTYELRSLVTWLKHPKRRPKYGFPRLERLRDAIRKVSNH